MKHRIVRLVLVAGLVVLIHNDMDVPFAREGSEPRYLEQTKALFKRHPKTTIIWAHTGMGRVVRPIKNHAAHVAAILADPAFPNVHFDLSWDEVAKYIVASPQATQITAALIKRFPDRFLFGTDEVAPPGQHTYLRVFYAYQPLWNELDPETCRKVRLGNYERIFDEARRKACNWESDHGLTSGSR